MSVLIKGMEMPQDCIECMRIELWNVFECDVSDVEEGQRLLSCPLVEVPTPHGRLIDADALLEHKTDHDMISTHLIYNAPTVIERED